MSAGKEKLQERELWEQQSGKLDLSYSSLMSVIRTVLCRCNGEQSISLWSANQCSESPSVSVLLVYQPLPDFMPGKGKDLVFVWGGV